MPTVDLTAGPAGELNFADPVFQTNPWPLYDWHREHQPVSFVPALDSYFVVGYDLVRRVVTSSDFTVYHPFRTSRRAFGPSMLDQEGAAHTRARAATAGVLRPRKVAEFARDIIAPLAAAALDDLLADARPDLVDRLATSLPMRVVCRFMGLPDADAEWLHEAMRPLVEYVDHAPVPLAAVVQRRRELAAYFRSRIAAGPDHGGILAVLAAEEVLTEADVVNNAILLLAAGTETTAAAITNLFARLAGDPALYAAVAADHALVPAIVAETLRHEPPLHVTLRFAASDVELAGVPIPRATPVQVCLAAANRDPGIYPDPHRFDHTRRDRPSLAFGAGRHVCLGMGLAQAELEVVLEALVERVAEIHPLGSIPPVRGRGFRAATGLRLDCRPGSRR
ncbi:cytochrome P450 [Micromonospora lutea]|uniref:Cytochrome P450 n=1 Tax=Micromonospora lutea TaxID=419825 RepID=A0ABQ4J245_9ACTN|nr:cytochrome P450 [Micromonospora lutea]GIJ24268.1 cytochrome P450 [Micromonospora lutea]